MASKKNRKFEQVEIMTLTKLEQVRVLADPLRIRIVEKLCEKEFTTKQVAEALGEKPTKLYHHVEALEKVGLIRQTRTKRNRGTLERYYLAVARTFTADSTLFAGDASPPAAEALKSVVSTIIETTSRELSELAASGSYEEISKEGLLSFCHLETDEKTIKRLQRRMHKLLTDVQALAESVPEEGGERKFRLTLAFYPLDRTGGDSD